jgi:hypothetical protein
VQYTELLSLRLVPYWTVVICYIVKQAMAEQLNQKRPREGDEEAEAMADNKRPREENEEAAKLENQAQQQPENEEAASSIDLQAQQQPEEKTVRRYSSSINLFHSLRERELGINRKLLNIYRDYHLHTFGNGIDDIGWDIIDLVIADHTIWVINDINVINDTNPFRRHGDQISGYTQDNGNLLFFRTPMNIKSVYYNNHNYSLIIVMFEDPRNILHQFRILSLKIPSIEAGPTTLDSKELFRGESIINYCDFDIPNCRGIIHNLAEGKFKVFELKNYTHLFTIPDIGGSAEVSYAKLGNSGNTDMLIYEKVSEGFSMRIYSSMSIGTKLGWRW